MRLWGKATAIYPPGAQTATRSEHHRAGTPTQRRVVMAAAKASLAVARVEGHQGLERDVSGEDMRCRAATP